MKKAGVVLVLIILLSTAVSAFSLTGYFSSLFSAQGTIITGTQANPIKVYPGQSLNILVAFEDLNNIESAIAYFPYEGGQDKVDMILSAGNENKGTYSATWVVHDTLNQKWYKTKVILTNSLGQETTTYVDWQDPTQSHPLDQLEPGISQNATSKSYTFWANTIGTNPLSAVAGESSQGASSFNARATSGFRPALAGVSTMGVITGGVYNHTGVLGWASGDGVSDPDFIYGVVGVAVNYTGRGTGVYGIGKRYGVHGEVPSPGGVVGEANYGVLGTTNSIRSTDAGVAGITYATNSYAGYFSGGRGVYSTHNITTAQSLVYTTSIARPGGAGFATNSCYWSGEGKQTTCTAGYYMAGVRVEIGGDENMQIYCCLP